jgi:methionine synthase I (cobalamin-dependent)
VLSYIRLPLGSAHNETLTGSAVPPVSLGTVHTSLAQRLSVRLDARQPIVFDGGVRGGLAEAGVPLDHPLGTAAVLQSEGQLVMALHQRFCSAGVHVVRANTSETTPRALSRTGYGYRAAKLSSLAIDLAVGAIESCSRQVGVAGVLPPMEARDEKLRGEQLAHAQRLAAAGADLIFVDPAHTLREAVAATAAAAQTGLPVIVALAVSETGDLSDGESLEAVCAALAGAGARGFIAAPSDRAGEVRATVELSGLGRPWGVYCAARTLSPTEYAERMLELAEEGASLLGGEDFATPEHVRALIGLVPGAERELRRPSVAPQGGVGALSNLPPRL